MENKFETASRLGIRFSSTKGLLTTEDLWVLPLTGTSKVNLNDIAKGLARDLKSAEEEDFVSTRSKEDTVTELKLEIVKYVIKVKIAERDAKATASADRDRNEQIKSIIATKQNEELEGKSIEELTAMMK